MSILGFDEFCHLMEIHCSHALMAEVSTTPKPGLVDCHDSGAHSDMDFHTFAASTEAITPYLVQMAGAGYLRKSCMGLFEEIRPIGIEAERAMFAATRGVNTHKGMIFSMGIVAAITGWYYHHYETICPEEILKFCADICSPALKQDFSQIDPEHPKTHGELLYVKYGARGIRGEVQDGFPSICRYSLPALRASRKAGADDNTAHLDTLLALMANVDDTNVLIRTSVEMLLYEKKCAAELLHAGGASVPGSLTALELLNLDFIEKNISPGGCADLLAVTILLDSLERSLSKNFEQF